MPSQPPSNASLCKTPLPSVFIAKHDFIWHGNIPLFSLGQVPLLCPLPSSCTPRTYSLGGQSRNVLMLWQDCSAITKTLCVTYSSSHKSKTRSKPTSYRLLWTKSIHTSQTQCNLHHLFHIIYVTLRSYTTPYIPFKHHLPSCHVIYIYTGIIPLVYGPPL